MKYTNNVKLYLITRVIINITNDPYLGKNVELQFTDIHNIRRRETRQTTFIIILPHEFTLN